MQNKHAHGPLRTMSQSNSSVQEGSARFRKVQEGSRIFENGTYISYVFVILYCSLKKVSYLILITYINDYATV